MRSISKVKGEFIEGALGGLGCSGYMVWVFLGFSVEGFVPGSKKSRMPTSTF